VRKIDRRLILEGLAKKPDIFLGVPALYGLLCLMKTAPIENIRLFVCGADALPDRIRSSFALVYNRKIANGYGMTESSPFISVDLEDITEPTNCVGRPCVNLDVQIRDEQGTVLPQGSVGQLWVKGPNIMLGYYNAQEQTNEVLKNGWLNTGDLAYINKHEKIVISGREKDIIKNKGLMIYPQEIENVILGHADVLRVGVIGKPDEAGEVPIAIVQIRADNPVIESQLLKLCKERLAPYKVPKGFIIIRHDPPLTATGKMNKKALKKEYLKDEKI
jgi:long-chain acyl-CoA synthetase